MNVTARDLKVLAIGAAATIGLTTILTSQYYGNLHQPCRIIDSPLPYIRKNLTKQEQDRLPYAPDALDGARDVATPFGSIRVYEWGPEDGRKVLLVHGINLFGRGFSSTPDPTSQPQDIQLFTTQILLVLSSSPISWTGDNNRFGLIGYSLGGGIAASFTSYFPNLVESLILIAPAGLMRPNHIHWTSRFLYGGFLPGKLVEYLIWRRLGGGSSSTPSRSNEDDNKITPSQAAEEETPPHPALSRDSSASISTRRPSVSIADVVSWQLTHHAGFIPSFISSIQHAPVSNQHSSWKTIATNQSCPSPQQRLLEKKVLLLLGRDDNVIIADELSEDAKAVLGDAVDICVLDGGHELPVTDADIVAQTIVSFWNQ
ncbi:putative alpha/beta hydrolase [Aureobasidium pullulans]|uniref:Putative alpha/beta hydrolase n=1 Tax=Aureobasidium pullulans TaxID=5580 RepID=A0A4S9AQ39_AURPU|nr:putative alpha/beta hydrolase [Aureobasidium pullulans]